MAPPPEATLYVIPGSHPAMVARRMLELKGIPYKRVDLMPVISRGALRALRFPSNTVPSLKIEGRKLTGSRDIARELDRIRPEPPLYPSDPDQRVAVEEAERWGDEVLQQWARRMVVEAGVRDPDVLAARGGAGRLGPLLTQHERPRRTMARLVKLAFRMSAKQLREDQGRVDEMLGHVDDLIGAGVLNGEQLNCADFQIATSVALVDYRLDLRENLRRRPGAQLMERVLPGPG